MYRFPGRVSLSGGIVHRGRGGVGGGRYRRIMSTQAGADQQGERRPATLEGVLERITYANEESGYTVARVDTGRGAGDLLTVVGALLGAQAA